jgi:hypothetical protein
LGDLMARGPSGAAVRSWGKRLDVGTIFLKLYP